jgi:hypothetical protein
MNEDQSSLTGLLASIGRGCVESLRQNKVATFLSAIAFAGTFFVAATVHYDERPRYRQVILPDIAEAESRFARLLSDAESTDNVEIQIHYLIAAHRRANEVLDVVKYRWPQTLEGQRAHADLIRYYELMTEDFAAIRSQLALREQMDFMAAWRQADQDRKPLRDHWARWVDGGK